MSRTRLSLDDVHALSMEALTASGADSENAEAVTHFMWAAERDSCHSHGLFRLPGYAASLKSGKVNGKSRPTVEDLAPAALRCNGDNGFAPMGLKVGREPLAERARETGLQRWRSPTPIISVRCGSKQRRWPNSAWSRSR